jgi:ribosomal protein S18 acetylase RimI-like enzyme
MTRDFFKVCDYQSTKAMEVAHLWRDSKRLALGNFNDPYSVEQYAFYLAETVSKDHVIKLVSETMHNKLVGFMALKGISLNQLYVHVAFQNRGVGAILIKLAKELSPGTLELHTFQVNKPARKFYEKHGFQVVGYGTATEENLPDMLYRWEAIR